MADTTPTATKGPARTVGELAALMPTHLHVKLDFAGEDGDIVMLGHVPDRRAVAAANALARRVTGSCNLLDDRREKYATAVLGLRRIHAVLLTACEHPADHVDGEQCVRCAEIRESGWWLRWSAAASQEPGAFPVTVWSW